MQNDKPVLNVEGLRNPMQKFHILAMFFFGPAIIPYSELARIIKILAKSLGVFW